MGERTAFPRGQRVRLNEAGRRAIVRTTFPRSGAVVGTNRDGTCRWILWDGFKWPQAWACQYLEAVDA